MLKVEFHDKAMRQYSAKMPAGTKRSISRALNKALARTKTQAARVISDKRNIKVGRASKDMRPVRASPAKPVAMIIARGHPIPLYEVKGSKRQTKKGVVAKIDSKGGPVLFPGTFIATMKSGHVGVFERQTIKSLPINEKRLPSVPSTMVTEAVEQQLQAFAAPVYEAELIRLMELEMVKSGAR